MLKPLLATGKPVVVTEFGFRTYWGADKAGAVGLGNADSKTIFLHQLPLVGRFILAAAKGGSRTRRGFAGARLRCRVICRPYRLSVYRFCPVVRSIAVAVFPFPGQSQEIYLLTQAHRVKKVHLPARR